MCVVRRQRTHLFARLLKLTANDKLIEYQVHLVEVKDEIELTDILEVLVENLDKEVNCLERHQFVVRHVAADGEEESSIPPVNELVRAELYTKTKKNAYTYTHTHTQTTDIENQSVTLVTPPQRHLFSQLITRFFGAHTHTRSVLCSILSREMHLRRHTSRKFVNLGSLVVMSLCTSSSSFLFSWSSKGA